MSRVDTVTPSPPTWRTDEILVGGLQYAAGVALMMTARVLAFTDHVRAAGSALLPGLRIVALYGADQIRFRAVLERAVLIGGAGTLVAPWTIGLADNDGATWAHVALGLVASATAVALLRIAGARVPDLVRSMTICDIDGARIEWRPYRGPMPERTLCGIVPSVAGRLDVHLVAAFRPVMTACEPTGAPKI